MGNNGKKWRYNISIIVPVYNSEKYIYDTLQSIFLQEFENFELIIVDDGCTDSSLEIINEFTIGKTIKYKIIHQENRGLPAARNAGIRSAEGKYICFIDSDDIISSQHLRTLFCIAEKNNLNVVHCNFEATTENNRQGSIVEDVEDKVYNVTTVIDYAVRRKPAILVCCLLIRTDFIYSKNLMFNEKLRFGEDTDYRWRVIFSSEKIGYTGKSTYKYLQHSGSIMHTITPKQADVYISEFKSTMQKIKQQNCDSNYVADMVFYRAIIGFLRAYAKCTSESDFLHTVSNIDTRSLFKCLVKFPEYRIRMTAALLRISPKMFRKVFSREWF